MSTQDIQELEAEITKTIIALRDEYVATGKAPDIQTINYGLCDTFADDVTLLLPDIDGLGALHITDFIKIDPETGLADEEGGEFDVDSINEHWPNITPPEGLTWEDMNQLSADAYFSSGTHVFLVFNEKFYDAEAEHGVDSPFELPFFQRCIRSWIEEKIPSPSM